MGNTLEFRNITKYFPGVKALDNVSFTAYSGEVLAFLGENGAGKSTLLKTLNGDYQPSSGQYLINGEEVHFRNPHEAIEAGVSIIYQERQILMELSVAENIYLGRMPANALGVINQHKANEMAARIIADFGLPIRPTDKVKDLSVAYQQMVEIMKAYSRENLRVICFDEPSASLSDSEIESLFRIIRKLRDEDKIIIYVSHRMSEIFEITDKVAVFKDGRYVDTVKTSEVDEGQLIRMMVGRDLGDIYSSLDRDKKIGDVLLEVRHLSSDYVDEVAAELMADKRFEFNCWRQAKRNKANYSLDAEDGIENSICEFEPSPEEFLARAVTIQRLCCALNHLPPSQGRRIDAHFLLGLSVEEIAQAEGVSCRAVQISIDRGLEKMRKIF